MSSGPSMHVELTIPKGLGVHSPAISTAVNPQSWRAAQGSWWAHGHFVQVSGPICLSVALPVQLWDPGGRVTGVGWGGGGGISSFSNPVKQILPCRASLARGVWHGRK